LEEAAALVEGEFGGGSDEAAPARIRFLLSVWPDKVIDDLKRFPCLLGRPEVSKLLAVLPFLLPPDRLGELEAVDGPLTREMLLVAAANEAVASGDDAAAAGHLNRLGLKSALRDARLFLEALMAFYNGDSDTAFIKLEKLRRIPVFQQLAEGLLPAVRIGNGTLDLETASRLSPPLGFNALEKAVYSKRLQTIVGLRKAEALIEKKEISRAWQTAVAWADTDDPVTIDLFHRDLVAIAASHNEDAVNLFERSLAALPSPLGGHRRIVTSIVMDQESQSLWAPFTLNCTMAVAPSESWSGKKPFDIRRVRAALLHRAAGMQRFSEHFDYDRFADEVDDEMYMNDLPIERLLDMGFSDSIPSAVELLEKAVALDDRREAYWQDLLAADRDINAGRDARRITERYHNRFPESLGAINAMVGAMERRKSYDKATRFVEKALGSHPMNTDLREALCRLLVQKAKKQIAAQKAHLAVKTYERVLEVPGVPPEQVTLAAAGLIALGRYRKEVVVDVAALIERSVQDGVGPWSLEVCVAVEAEAQRPRSMSGKTGTVSLMPPDADPTEADLRYLLDLYDERPDSRVLRSEPARAFFCKAIERGEAVMTRYDTLRMASKRVSGELKLRLLERCQSMPEADVALMVERYELALVVGRPKDYFKDAVKELKAVMDRLDPFQGGAFIIIGRLRSLVRQIERRMRKREKPPKKKTAPASRAAPKRPTKDDKDTKQKDDAESPDPRQTKLPF
jgi:tetratricopeptide (TPR) repeat protein